MTRQRTSSCDFPSADPGPNGNVLKVVVFSVFELKQEQMKRLAAVRSMTNTASQGGAAATKQATKRPKSGGEAKAGGEAAKKL